jgi:predicted dehydrogenase
MKGMITMKENSTQKKIKIAFIGCGEQANLAHYPSLSSFEDVEIAAVCDLNAERMNDTANKFSIDKRYTDYRKMVEDVSPDAVYAIGQTHYMYEIWMWCLSQGLNLFVEKPAGFTVHQIRNLAYMADKKNCITQVGFQRRCAPLAVKMKEECINHGPIMHAVCSFYKFAMNPYLGAIDHMYDDGVHAIDTLRWLCGGEVVSVTSRIGRVQTPDINLHIAMLGFDNGSTGVMLTNWTSGRRIFRFEMHSPGACAEVNVEDKGFFHENGDVKGIEYNTRYVAGSDKFHVYAGYEAENRKFINSVKAGIQPDTNFADAVKTSEIAEKILHCELNQH